MKKINTILFYKKYKTTSVYISCIHDNITDIYNDHSKRYCYKLKLYPFYVKIFMTYYIAIILN